MSDICFAPVTLAALAAVVIETPAQTIARLSAVPALPAPCSHAHVEHYQTGGFHFVGGSVDDDITDHFYCRDCGRDIDPADARPIGAVLPQLTEAEFANLPF